MLTLLVVPMLVFTVPPDAGVVLSIPAVREGAAPVAFIDSPGEACSPAPSGHVELLDVETGKARAESRAWSTVLLDVGEGGVLVTNEDVRGAGTLSIAALRRTDLTRIFSCTSKVSVAGRRFTWMLAGDHLTVAIEPRHTSGGHIRALSSPPAVGLLELQLAGDRCSLVPPSEQQADSHERLPVPVSRYTGGELLSEGVTNGASTLAAERGGKQLWKRVRAPAAIPCRAP